MSPLAALVGRSVQPLALLLVLVNPRGGGGVGSLVRRQLISGSDKPAAAATLGSGRDHLQSNSAAVLYFLQAQEYHTAHRPYGVEWHSLLDLGSRAKKHQEMP